MDPRVKAARVSVMSNAALVTVKLAAGLTMGSVSVISEAIHSGLDLVAALIALLSVAQAARPADERHQFGHGKVENVSGLVEALLILVAAAWIIVESYKKLVGGAPVEALALGMAVMGASALVNLFVSRYLFRVARATDSIALKADAMHLSTDVLTSVGVLGGLTLMRLTGFRLLDPLAAIAVALLIVKASVELSAQAFSPLLDIRLPRDEEQEIIGIIGRYQGDFVGFHRLRSRKAGAERHIDLHLVVPDDRHVGDVHAVCDRIEADIKDRFPASHVVIHVEPPGDEAAPTAGGMARSRRNGNR